MAYAGYRLKIDGTIFPNNDIAKGTYKLSSGPRIAQSWKDITGIGHNINYPTNQTNISFSIREHTAADHITLASFFTSDSVDVEYYDDNSDMYKEGSFEVERFTWNHINTDANGIFYGATAIKLKEW